MGINPQLIIDLCNQAEVLSKFADDLRPKGPVAPVVGIPAETLAGVRKALQQTSDTTLAVANALSSWGHERP